MKAKKNAGISVFIAVFVLLALGVSAVCAGFTNNSAVSAAIPMHPTTLALRVLPKEQEKPVISAPREEVTLVKDNFAMANIASEADVVAEGKAGSEVIGKIYPTTSVEVLEHGDEWTHIKTGNVEGFVPSSMLLFGSEGRVLMNAKCEKSGVIEAETGLYAEADKNAEVAATAAVGDTYLVTAQLSGWYQLTDGSSSFFVPAECIRTEARVAPGKTVQELQAEQAAAEQAQREAAEQAQRAAEEAQRAAQEQQAQAEAQAVQQVQAAAEQAVAEQAAAEQAPEEEDVQETTASASYTNTGNDSWDGEVLNKRNGVVQGPSGKETYYNLNMNGVINNMREAGNNDEYWVREDGVKMLGDYVMVAADFDTHPLGSHVETSLGEAVVCDTGTFAYSNPTQVDVAVEW